MFFFYHILGILSADWLRQRAFFLNQEGSFDNQEGMVT